MTFIVLRIDKIAVCFSKIYLHIFFKQTFIKELFVLYVSLLTSTACINVTDVFHSSVSCHGYNFTHIKRTNFNN